MTVLIAKQNQSVITKFDDKIKFTQNTENTCTFKISEMRFNDLFLYIQHSGYNPFALMSW